MSRKRLLACLLPLTLLACGDIIIAPGGEEAPRAPVVVPVILDGGASTLGQQASLSCPGPEPVVSTSSSIAPLDAGGGATECTADGGACEYGASADPACDNVFSCSAGTWFEKTSDLACFSAACVIDQATLIAQIDGTECDLGPLGNPPDEAICNVADGTCACTTGPDGGDPHPRRWACTQSVLLTCPVHRPRLGSTCGSEGLFCDYGSCVSKRGIAVICQDSQWVETKTTCN